MVGSKADTLGHLHVDASGDSVVIKAAKLNKTTRLNFMDRLAFTRSVNGYELGQLEDGAVLYMDGSQQRGLEADFLFPAWLVSITTEDQATMHIVEEKVPVVLDKDTKVDLTLKVPVPKPAYAGAKNVVLSRCV